MKLEDQVCSLELAKRLKELGAKQESLFYYSSYQGMPIDSPLEWKLSFGIPASENISAFTVAELGEMLPNMLDHPDEDGQTLHLICEKSVGWSVHYSFDGHYKDFYSQKEADARAKMIIHLIGNNLIKGPE